MPNPQSRAGDATFRTVRSTVVFDYLLSHLGFFTISPVLAVALVQNGFGSWVGPALFAFNFAMRGASLFLVKQIAHATFRKSAITGLLMSSVSFGILGFPVPTLVSLVMLTIAGVGISINGTTMRLYIASQVESSSLRHRAFTVVQTTVNIAAAVGPILGNYLFGFSSFLLFGAVSVLYLLASFVLWYLLPADLSPDPTGVRPPISKDVIASGFRSPPIRLAMLLSITGGFMYAQLFSGFAISISNELTSPLAKSAVYVGNAVLVVLFQYPVAKVTVSRLDSGTRPISVMCLGLFLFAASLVLLGAIGNSLIGFLFVIVVFSAAETVYTPTVDTVFTSLDPNRNFLELINLRQIAVSLGESTGALVGSYLAMAAFHSSFRGLPWYIVAAVAMLIAWFGMIRSKSVNNQDTDHRKAHA